MSLGATSEEAVYNRIYNGGKESSTPSTPKATNWSLRLFLVALLIVGQLYFLRLSAQPDQYDPLGEYPVQEVMNRLPGVDVPALRLGDTVEVVGTKCNNTNNPVTVEGRSSWVSVEPPGGAYASGEGIGTRDPGCVEKIYQNVIPKEVEERSSVFFEQGKEYVVWRITGVETPADEPNGVSRSWTTVNFRIYPKTP